MSAQTEHDDLDLIRVRLPLKLDIAAALTKAIGIVWPEAVMLTDGYPGDLVAGIPKNAKARTAKRPLAAAAREAREGAPGSIASIHPDGATITEEPNAATQALAHWAYTVLTSTDGAVNYVEQQVHLPDDAAAEAGHGRLVVIAAWSDGQTPAQLRDQAERRAMDLEAQLAEAHARIQELEGTA